MGRHGWEVPKVRNVHVRDWGLGIAGGAWDWAGQKSCRADTSEFGSTVLALTWVWAMFTHSGFGSHERGHIGLGSCEVAF
jgi:hypothetical protein